MSRKKYNTLSVTLRQNSDKATNGIYVNDDCYITARRKGGRVVLTFTAPESNYNIQRETKEIELKNIPDELIEQVAENERKYIERKSDTNKKNTILKKKPRFIYNENFR